MRRRDSRVRPPWRTCLHAAAAAVVLLVVAGCTGPRQPPAADSRPAPSRTRPATPSKTKPSGKPVWAQTGLASWYGKPFQGRPTASGERFDMHAMTAAHRELPFGTVVRVTNLRNGRQTVVRINDRGPFVKGRVIDLSYAAARKLDMVTAGVDRVKVEIVRPA